MLVLIERCQGLCNLLNVYVWLINTKQLEVLLLHVSLQKGNSDLVSYNPFIGCTGNTTSFGNMNGNTSCRLISR